MIFQQKPAKINKIQSNQPFLPLNPQVILLVRSGQISIFASLVINQQPTGERHYLFDQKPGEALFSVPVFQNFGILAIALEEVELEELSLEDFSRQIAIENRGAIALLESWLQHLEEALAQKFLPFKSKSLQKNPDRENTLLLPKCSLSTPYSFESDRSIQPPENQILWIKISQGQTTWRGFKNLVLERKSPWFPLVKGSWLTAIAPTDIKSEINIPFLKKQGAGSRKQGEIGEIGEKNPKIETSLSKPIQYETAIAPTVIEIAPTQTAIAPTVIEIAPTHTAIAPTFESGNSEQLSASLEIVHKYFCYAINTYLKEEKKTKSDRFQAREKLNQQLTSSAYNKLASVLQPQQITSEQTGTPLLIVAGAIARLQKIKIKPPASSEDLNLLRDPIEAIARASQCRIRRVQLTENWWQQEHGPLLGYTSDRNSPVALLPNREKGKGYLLFDPDRLFNPNRLFNPDRLFNPNRQNPIPVTQKVARNISTLAYTFYRPLPLVVNNILSLFQFGIFGYQKDLLLIVLVGALATILGMVVPQITGTLIDLTIPNSDRLLLSQMGLALLAAAIGRSAFQLSQGIITLRVENATDVNLQLAVWDRLLKLTPAFLRQYTSGDLLNRLLAIRQIRSQLSGATQRTLLSGIFSLLNLGLMFIYSVKLALIGLGISIAAIIVTIASGILLVRKERQQENLDGEIDGLTVQLIGGVSKLRVAAAEERAFATWADKYSQKTKLTNDIQQINDAVSTFNEILPLISSILLFWFTIAFVQTAQAQGNPTNLTIGTFLAFSAAFGTFISGVTNLSNTLTDILGIVPLWERAKSLVQAPTEYDPNLNDSGRLTGRIVLERISFRYRENGPPILDNVSIQANPGEFIAVVGPSGSGKSTLFRLLLGFETPQSGTVYYDGQDLKSLDLISVRRQLGVVLQNGRVQQSSIFDNIACGALITLKEAWSAAEMAGLAADIERMPMGMHTIVSVGGSNLSGGQRQRLLIARALIKKPKIILMDEATSALDNRTQTVVTRSLERINATRIVIAHRLSTIRHADRIYVLEAGRVVQVGSFVELIELDGSFARLVARQLE